MGSPSVDESAALTVATQMVLQDSISDHIGKSAQRPAPPTLHRQTCDRARLTADGMWYLCLYANKGIDLRGALRSGASLDEMKALITGGWQKRTDRGAEERLASADRKALAEAAELRRDPHLEMHTRGG